MVIISGESILSPDMVNLSLISAISENRHKIIFFPKELRTNYLKLRLKKYSSNVKLVLSDISNTSTGNSDTHVTGWNHINNKMV